MRKRDKCLTMIKTINTTCGYLHDNDDDDGRVMRINGGIKCTYRSSISM